MLLGWPVGAVWSAHGLPINLAMRNVRFHPADQMPSGAAPQEGSGCGGDGPANRLNLLLSYAGWDETPWVDRLPTLLDPMGIQSHRAADAREATRVIESMPIHVAVVDLALPLERAMCESDRCEEAGPRVLALLARLKTPPPTLVIKRGRTNRDDRREMAAALKAGAFAVLDRPRAQQDLETLLEVLRRVLSRHYANRWPGQAGQPPTAM